MHLGPIVRAMLRNKVRFGLLALEVALTLAIVANCVSLILDARRELTRPSGFVDDQLMMVTATPFNEAFKDDAYPRHRRRPGPRGAACRHRRAARPPTPASCPGRVAAARRSSAHDRQAEQIRTQIYSADDRMLDTLGVRLVEGRAFTRDDVLRNTDQLRKVNAIDRERDASGLVTTTVTVPAIISRAYAKLMFPEGSPLGKTFEDNDGDRWQVVGVVDTFYNPYAWKIGEYVTFYPQRQGSYDNGTSYLVRVKPGQLAAVEKASEQVLASVNANRTYPRPDDPRRQAQVPRQPDADGARCCRW